LAFGLAVVNARSRRPELLLAVALSYALGVISGEHFQGDGFVNFLLTCIGAVAIGSGLLALSLGWKGGLSWVRARNLFLLGTALALPFLAILIQPPGEQRLLHWIAGFSVWQMPVAWYYLKES
jgi:hypothetical protein